MRSSRQTIEILQNETKNDQRRADIEQQITSTQQSIRRYDEEYETKQETLSIIGDGLMKVLKPVSYMSSKLNQFKSMISLII